MSRSQFCPFVKVSRPQLSIAFFLGFFPRPPYSSPHPWSRRLHSPAFFFFFLFWWQFGVFLCFSLGFLFSHYPVPYTHGGYWQLPFTVITRIQNRRRNLASLHSPIHLISSVFFFFYLLVCAGSAKKSLLGRRMPSPSQKIGWTGSTPKGSFLSCHHKNYPSTKTKNPQGKKQNKKKNKHPPPRLVRSVLSKADDFPFLLSYGSLPLYWTLESVIFLPTLSIWTALIGMIADYRLLPQTTRSPNGTWFPPPNYCNVPSPEQSNSQCLVWSSQTGQKQSASEGEALFPRSLPPGWVSSSPRPVVCYPWIVFLSVFVSHTPSSGPHFFLTSWCLHITTTPINHHTLP